MRTSPDGAKSRQQIGIRKLENIAASSERHSPQQHADRAVVPQRNAPACEPQRVSPFPDQTHATAGPEVQTASSRQPTTGNRALIASLWRPPRRQLGRLRRGQRFAIVDEPMSSTNRANVETQCAILAPITEATLAKALRTGRHGIHPRWYVDGNSIRQHRIIRSPLRPDLRRPCGKLNTRGSICLAVSASTQPVFGKCATRQF